MGTYSSIKHSSSQLLKMLFHVDFLRSKIWLNDTHSHLKMYFLKVNLNWNSLLKNSGKKLVLLTKDIRRNFDIYKNCSTNIMILCKYCGKLLWKHIASGYVFRINTREILELRPKGESVFSRLILNIDTNEL